MSTTTRFFEDATHSQNYALFRPVPPDSIVKAILRYTDEKGNVGRNAMLDVGCGSGQSTLIWSGHFERVIGIDISRAMIHQAITDKGEQSYENVEFRESCEKSFDFPDNFFDLVTTCQAIHWFDIPAFYNESKRILKPGGTVAILGYSLTGPSQALKNWNQAEKIRDETYSATRSFWSPLRQLVDDKYKNLPELPFRDVERDDSHFSELPNATLENFVGYVKTWSGFREMVKKSGETEGEKLIDGMVTRLKVVLGEPSSTALSDIKFPLRTNYFLLLGRK